MLMLRFTFKKKVVVYMTPSTFTDILWRLLSDFSENY
ncbi:unnamed protein product [Brassica oleracea]|uniref:(rape) hypothetical protein n=1 Tax=Brassica napus TaxID=3708 RepID=A0A816IFT0_BRANA|nr:unnamed protein product [Brassica napus]